MNGHRVGDLLYYGSGDWAYIGVKGRTPDSDAWAQCRDVIFWKKNAVPNSTVQRAGCDELGPEAVPLVLRPVNHA